MRRLKQILVLALLVVALLSSGSRANTPFALDLDLFSDFAIGTPLELGRVTLDGRLVFQIATPSESELTARVRERTIETRLRQVAVEALRNERLPLVSYTFQNEQIVIQADDEYLFTVTALDAQLYGTTPQGHAATLISQVRRAFERYQSERQVDHLIRQGIAFGAAILTLVAASLILRRYQRLWRVQLKTIQDSLKTHSLDQRLIRYEIRERFGELGQIVLWVGIPIYAIGLFPHLRPLQQVLLFGFGRRLLSVLGVGIVTYGVLRLSFVVIDYVFIALQNNAFLVSASARLSKRLQTLISVVKGATSGLVLGAGFIVGLTLWDVDPIPLLAGAGILGFAISFGAQNLVRDVINGFFILLEDQYSIGDVITTAGVSGFVESMNLRITQIRSADGNLITIPNGQITVVENLTNGFSRANLGIDVAYDTDLDQAIRVIGQVADGMSQEPGWREMIVNPPLILGVDDFGDNSITIRIWIDTQPLQQWNVAREYRLRLKKAFDAAGITIPFPQRSVWFKNALPPTHHYEQESPAKTP